MHLHRSTDSPIGVILVSHRSTEDGKNAIAEDLVDASAERNDVSDKQLERSVDEALDLLGVEMLAHRRVADEVSEYHGDYAALFGGSANDLVPTERAEPCAVRKRL
jgi:hypothetical protein